MVTDQQYRAAIERIEKLENMVSRLSKALAEMKLMSQGRQSVPQNHEVYEAKRDTTRYRYNGNLYCKRNLVLAVVKDYVRKNNIVSFSDVQSAFPDSVQGSLGVVRSVADAERYADATSRFFFGDDDVIALDEGVYVVCKEWTLKNIQRFIGRLQELDVSVEIVNR